MKRIKLISLVLAAVLVAGTALTGCTSKTEEIADAVESETTPQTESGLVRPESYGTVELGDYMNMSIELQTPEASDELVDQSIEYLLNNDVSYETVDDRAAELGDTVNIDYKGTENGEAFSGGTAEGTDLELGSGTFVANFEDELVGLNVGDTKTFDLTFPEDYGAANLAGHTVQFEVTVNEIKTKIVPELNDEWVSSWTNGEYTTVEDYKAYVKETLTTERTESNYTNGQYAALNQATAEATCEVNPDAVEYEYQCQLEALESQLASAGMTFDDYGAYYNMTGEEFKQNIKDSADDVVMQKLVTDAIFEAEKMELEDADYDYVAELYSTTYEDMKNQYSAEVLEQAAKTYKVTRFLYDNVNITYVD